VAIRLICTSIKPFITRFLWDSNFSNALSIEILSFSQSLTPNEDLVTRLFPLVVNAAASHFELQRYSSALKRYPSDDYPYSSWPYEEKGRRDASIIVKFHQQVLQFDRKKAFALLRQIQSETESLPDYELDRLVIPLLEQMVYLVDLSPVDAQQFYTSMLTTYIRRVVQKEPEKPSDWARLNEKLKCYSSTCRDCPMLEEFLADTEAESRSFEARGPLCYTAVPHKCTQVKDNSQEPPLIVVTKTLKGWEENHAQWEKRASKARETLKRLPLEQLKQCLAKDYDAIMDLRMVRVRMKRPRSDSSSSGEQGSEETRGIN
jgi:hypothetical protein